LDAGAGNSITPTLKIMKLTRSILALTLLWMIVPQTFAQPYFFLKKGHMSCDYQRRSSLEAIADAKTDEAYKSAAIHAVYSGACTALSKEQVAISHLTEFHTNAGRRYYCFNPGDDSGAEGTVEFCALESDVTSIHEEKDRRTGDYKIVEEGPNSVKAECAEGGSVILLKKPQSWERMSLVFPKATDVVSRPISNDRASEIRLGCKGIDYDD